MKPMLLKTMIAAAALAVSAAQTNPLPASRASLQTAGAPSQPALPVFDLDFPGGTPGELVQAIQSKIGLLNAIIPSELRNEQLPPLKMRSINVQQLFEAIEVSSQAAATLLGFRAGQPIRPETVWSFYARKNRRAPAETERMVRYYQLGHYLTRYKLDDITTAVQAGWKMLGEGGTPELNYHQDTKLLIAVGEIAQLQVIDSVLQELSKGLAQPAPQPPGAGTTPARP